MSEIERGVIPSSPPYKKATRFWLLPMNSDLSLQWWSMKNRYLEWWGKFKDFGKENDIAEIYFIMDRSELCFQL